MAKFTIILDYRGGTYIRQLKAPSPMAALQKLGGATEKKAAVFRELSKDKPVSIEGLDNCWCASASVRGNFVLANIVKTSEGT